MKRPYFLTWSLCLLFVLLWLCPGAHAQQQQEQVFTYANHRYTQRGAIDYGKVVRGKYQGTPTAWVTFTHVPSDYREFAALYDQFLGLTPHGTAAMIAMALELYGRNPDEGARCLELLCGKTHAAGILRILKTKFPKPGHDGAGDSYVQRYLPAAILKGATAKNAYTPAEPYTVEMCSHVNKPQGDYTFIYILGGGWDSRQRGVTVKLLDDGHYQLDNCPSVYTQCQTIKGRWPGLR